tara:strand:- start:3666 stop:4868 length:1203 start_codon:yes stop_codon:yes gene_type:complete
MYSKKKLPTTQYELSKGVKNKAFGRSNDIRRDNDKLKELTIGLYDLDFSIKWYFDNVIKPKVDDFGRDFNVPVVYGSPEKWKNVQEDGYLRDASGKIQAPIITYKRTGVTKNRNLGNKVDANFPALYQSQEIKYNGSNKYDQFAKLTNLQPTKSFINTIIPEYVDITYDVIIWTDFVEHMNGLVESVIYSEGSYWGEPERFKFRTKVDDYQNTTDLLQDNDRIVRTSFTLTLYGYLVPDALIKNLSKSVSNKTNSVQKLNTALTLDEDGSQITEVSSQTVGATNTFESTPTQAAPNPVASSVDPLILAYLNTNITKVATSISIPNEVTFNAGFLSAPSGLPNTTAANFQFFINGQLIEPAAVTSFVDNGNNTTTLTINVTELGFTIATDDEVLGVGKFNT